MKSLTLDLRYYHYPERAGVTEAEGKRRTLRLALPVDSVALVLVDVWNDIAYYTFRERMRRITSERIVPLAEAFRKVGAPVIHAPSPSVARKYPSFIPPPSAEEAADAPRPLSDWPPKEFREKRGPYAAWARPSDPPDARFLEIIEEWRIAPEMEPRQGDLVILTGEHLHRVLRERKILWLFYAGFAANICMLRRDYGMRAMELKGYGIVLIRDATTGIEVAETCGHLMLTEAVVVGVERNIGYSATSADLLAACQNASAEARSS